MYAVVDIGSNAIRFAAYSASGADLRKAERIFIKEYAAPLVAYVTPHGRMSREGIRRALEALEEIRTGARLLGIEPFAVLRSWFAGLKNGGELHEELCGASGLNIRLLNSREEAEMRLIGAGESVSNGGLLIDVDGGDTGIIKKSGERCELALSLPIGAVGLYFKTRGGIEPSREDIRRMERAAVRTLEESGVSVKTLESGSICVTGSFALAALRLYGEFSGIHGADRIPARFFDDYISRAEVEPKKLVERILLTEPDKLNTLTPYMAIMRVIRHISGASEIRVCQKGLMEGYLYRAGKTRRMIERADNTQERGATPQNTGFFACAQNDSVKDNVSF